MSQKQTTEELGSLFEAVTGNTTVVESQDAESGDREVGDNPEPTVVDAIDHHGFDDVIDAFEPADHTI